MTLFFLFLKQFHTQLAYHKFLLYLLVLLEFRVEGLRVCPTFYDCLPLLPFLEEVFYQNGPKLLHLFQIYLFAQCMIYTNQQSLDQIFLFFLLFQRQLIEIYWTLKFILRIKHLVTIKQYQETYTLKPLQILLFQEKALYL